MPVSTELSDVWPRIDAELRRAVGDATHHHWLSALTPRELTGSALVVSAPDTQRAWVAGRFGRLLQACAVAILGPGTTVDLVGDADAEGGRPAAHRTLAARAGEHPEQAFNPKYTFDQFVIGDGNRLAHGAALAVAELPGQAYNPLFIYGPPGLGKTHLLHSIANYVATHSDGLTVRYTTVEAFTNEFISALRTRDVDRFKSGYRTADVLLIDDVQFLESKARTEEEFFHTFNALYESGSQLVLTSDRLPRDMDALEDRLRERFESGLVTDIEPPDLQTRLTILRKRAHHDGIEVAEPAALVRIAERIDDNVRSLEGALIRVVAFHSLTGRPITEELALEVLDGLYPDTRVRRCSVRDIQELTCEAFGITLDELLSQSRAARLAWPRHVAMYLARELTDQTLPRIGREFGGRNHATVLHACRRTSERIAADADAFEIVRSLTERLRSGR